MMEDTRKLAELRKEIDKVDEKLVTLLNKRAQLALRVRIVKGGGAIYRPQREAEVINHVVAANKGPLSSEAIKTLFHSIIFICRAIQEIKIRPND